MDVCHTLGMSTIVESNTLGIIKAPNLTENLKDTKLLFKSQSKALSRR
jgi:hypothetical protein